MKHSKPMRALFLATAAAAGIGTACPMRAAENSTSLADALALEPLAWEIDSLEIRLGGFAGGALFTAMQSGGPGYPGGYDNTRASAQARTNLRVQRILDNGMILGARSDFLLYRDELSGDEYDNDTVERLYLFAQTGFGRVEIGQMDGAAFTIGLTGPAVAQEATLENPHIALFRNPVTERDFADFFQSITAVQSTSNFAKLNYVSPRLLGIQIGASFTPETVRTPLPWTGNPADAPDRQRNIWEAAASYTGFYSGLAIGFSAGYARGALKNPTASGADLYDLALGAQLAYMVWEVRLSLGGAFRDTNSYLFNTNMVLDGVATHALHLSTTAEWGAWRLGAEYSKADVRGPVGYQIAGYETALAYKLNDNLELAAGWQWYDYERNAGAFYNGLPAIDMNAGFLTLSYAL